MLRNWNPPRIDVEPGVYEVAEDGSVSQGVRVTFCPEDIEMFRQGYKCLGPMDSPGLCGELHPHAFPDACFICGFPMKKEQARVFELLYRGWRDAPKGQINEDEEFDRLERQRFEREQREGLRSSGIVIPRNAKL